MGQTKTRGLALCARAGFTLIELLLVMVILTILAAVVVPKFVNRGVQARMTRAHTDISTLETALDVMETDTGRYPTSAEGLQALLNAAADMTEWHGPYVKLSNDPWGHPYQYKYPGEHNTAGFDLYSLGPDGQEGGDDDIDNWTQE